MAAGNCALILGSAQGRNAQRPPRDSEYHDRFTYLQWLARLPWNARDEERIDLQRTRELVDKQHWGLAKAKKRILEYLAVRKLGGGKGAILCLVGPPGVGKTSMARSIADAIGRKFAAFSCAGVSDATELRGHNRTWRGAQPGRLLREFVRIGAKNPVLMLDEIDTDMPPKVPMNETERLQGINIYNDEGLVHRKLGTMVGEGRTRQKARDIYDTEWLVNEKPELINIKDRKLLKTWMNNITPTKIKMLKRRLERDGVTGRVNADTIISMLRNGIQRLEIPTDPHDKEHRRSDVPTSDTSGRPNLKPPSQASAGQSTEKRGNTADAAGERSGSLDRITEA